jgi:hypothetical protein
LHLNLPRELNGDKGLLLPPLPVAHDRVIVVVAKINPSFL